jgi:phage gp29-like protein
MATLPTHTAPTLSPHRAKVHLQSRFNPIRGLTPETLSSYLDAFDLGYLGRAALLWQKIRDRDDTVKAVAEKRELSVSRLNWEILTVKDSPEAKLHQKALTQFYNRLTVTNALDRNQRGGVATLIRQMMHAQGHKYAVHELIWNPRAADLTAEFRFTPLQFFENRTGALRFLHTDLALEGEALEEGGWMVTVGAGLMEATSIAYLFKQLPLRDWLLFCEKAGIPALHGKTDAQKGTKEWEDFRDALANFGVDWALVTSLQAQVSPVDLKTSSELPHPLLVDRMDRGIARLWRGADLGTMAKAGQAVGANPQERETDVLEAADAMLISETLQHNVDRWVTRYRFGVEPLAYFQLQPRVWTNREQELKIDDYLIRWGVRRSKRELLARYGRPEPEPNEDLATIRAETPTS